MSTFYITTPLYYVNSRPHIGHSYTQIACDTMARFRKQCGDDVFFMTGTDEHGEKIEKATLDSGLKEGEEKKFVDGIVPHFKELWAKLSIDYDYFIRTTDPVHEETVKTVLSLLHEKGMIYKKVYEGWFCTPCETFWSKAQAPDGICPDCERSAEQLDEENYFLKISEYRQALRDHIKAHPHFIQPETRKNEVVSFLESNELQDLCISRPKKRLAWGIEIPFDSNFVTYVWVDALINYISGIGFLNDRERFESLWGVSRHVIGKDILRHHAIYWAIMLLALGERPPYSIFAHGWWVVGGEKMSKSKGNVVDPMAMIDKYGVEPFRYYLLSAVQFGYDGTFSEKLFVEKYNSDLANDLGNLVSRTRTMVEKYFDGVVPRAHDPSRDDEIKRCAEELPGHLCASFERWDFQSALGAIWDVINVANKYIEDKAPWKLAKENDREALGAVIYTLLETLGIIAVSLHPFMPQTARSIWAQIGVDSDIRAFKLTDKRETGVWGLVASGTRIRKEKVLFPRIEVS